MRLGISEETTILQKKQVLVPIDAFFAIIFFVFAPLYSMPLVLMGIINRKKWAYVLAVIFAGFTGMLYPPAGDAYRYADDFFACQSFDWQEFRLFILLKQDVFLPLLSWCLGHIGLRPESTRFVFVATSYLLFFLIYHDITEQCKCVTIKERFYLFVLIVPLVFSPFIFRMGLARAIFVFGTYLYLFKNNKIGFFFLVFSTLVHFTFIPFLLLELFCKRTNKNTPYWLFCILALLLFVAPYISIGAVMIQFFLPVSYLDHYISYISGDEAAAVTTGFSVRQFIAFFYDSFTIVVNMVLYLSFYKHNPQPLRIKRFITFFILVLIVCGSIAVVFSRYLGILDVLLSLTIAYYFRVIDKPIIYQFIIWLSLLSAVIQIWQLRFFIGFSEFDTILTASSFDMLNFYYSDDWVRANVDDEGLLIRWLEAGYEVGR